MSMSTLEYFNGDTLATDVFRKKYALTNDDDEVVEDTPKEMHRRLAREFARIEAKYPNPMTEDEIFELFDRFRYIIPQGSPMYGIGRKNRYISLSNCFVVDSPGDSYGSIMKTDEELVQISKRRGGVGVDISTLRPRGSMTRNSCHTSTGAVAFAERFSNSIREVGQNGRRGALMVSMSIHHPDIAEFIEAKTDLKKITGANVSVRLTDEFLKAVDEDKSYQLRFPVEGAPKITTYVSAREIWNKIVQSAHKSAEPGILMWDTILRESPADCYKDLGFATKSTNPCGEVPLSPYDSCRLMVINLYSFVKNPFTSSAYFDFDEFKTKSMKMQRLMDDMIDLETECIKNIIAKIDSDPESDEQKACEKRLWNNILDACERGRRTGSGIVGLGDCIAALGLKYGTPEATATAVEIYKTLKLACYRSSNILANERGAFPIWNYELEKDCPFLQRIASEDPDLGDALKSTGRRNIALLTIAPTGSVAILAGVTSGVEPAIWLEYKRRRKVEKDAAKVDFVDHLGDKWEEYIVRHPKLIDWMNITGETDASKSPWHGCCAEDIDPIEKVRMQGAIQQHCDHSISVTTNLPEHTTLAEVEAIYLMAWRSGCKGATIYRAGSRSGVLVALDKNDDRITKSKAPKRPQSLPCRIHGITYKGVKYIVIVGLLGNDPYEIFITDNNIGDLAMYENASIVKNARGRYHLHGADKHHVEIKDHSISEDVDGMTRLISTALRHGVDLNFVVSQLEKSKGSLISFSKVIVKVLKGYIPDGTKIHGDACESCGGDLIRIDGCITCSTCGWSKC